MSISSSYIFQWKITKILSFVYEVKLPLQLDAKEKHQAGIKDIVSQNSLLLEAKRLSTCLPVVPLNVQSGDGFARTLTSVVEYHLSLPENRHLLKTADDEVTIWLRFACDSTKVNRCKNAVKAVCRLIPTNHRERYNRTDSPEDEITLFLYMGKEDRPSLSEASRTIVEQMRTAATQGFPIRGKTVKAKWLFCSDWKTTALFKGINVASADYFCIWCYCTRDRISDFSGTEWKVERKASDQALCLGANAEETKGYEAEDLLPFIPFDCVVPDELHLGMRITNKLLNQVVAWSVDHGLKDSLLREMSRLSVDFRFTEQEDGTGSITKWTQLTGEQLQKVLEKLDVSKVIDRKPRGVSNLHLLSTDILRRLVENRGRGKVPATWNKSDLVLHLYSLLSPDEQRSLVVVQTESSEESAMQLGSLPDSSDLPSPPIRLVDPAAIQQLWRDFSALMQHMQSPPGLHQTAEDNALRFHQAAKQWADKFRQETSDEDVIPYIHCMVYHVPEMLKNLHYVKDIGTAQLGRKNYEQHLVYFQGTNRQGGNKKKPVTQQILERENRLLDFRRRTSADPEQDGEADSDSDYEVDMQGSHDGPDADSPDLGDVNDLGDAHDLGDVPDTGDDHDHDDAHDFADAPDANLTGSDSDDDAN
ncbi:hypothetical protein ACOMHN_046567 [Nucella lapillus]